MDSPNLAFAIGLPPEKAVEYLQSKGLKVSAGWRTVDEATHARAFTVANVSKLDVLKDIQDHLVQAQKQGQTMQQFRDGLVPALRQKGWFAERGEPARAIDAATGQPSVQKRLTARRLETIFGTNMQSSMMASRYRELMANAGKRPWFEYVAILDGRTRPAHRAMSGRVFRSDDPGWAVWWPPCGFKCRCRVRARDAAELAAQNLTPESSVGRTETSHVPLPDGSTSTVTRYRPANGGASFAPDPGFNGNPAMIQAADRLAVLRAPEVLPAAQAQAELNKLFASPTRIADLHNFANSAREAEAPIFARIGVGALDEAAALKLADEGVLFDQTQPITLGDALIHTDREALPAEIWAAVPEALAYGAVHWDQTRRMLVYTDAPAAVARGRYLRVSVSAAPDNNFVATVDVPAQGEVPAGDLVRQAVARTW